MQDKNGATQRGRDNVVLAQKNRKKDTSGTSSSPRPLMALSDAALRLKVRASMSMLSLSVDPLVQGRSPRGATNNHWRIKTVGCADLSKQE